MPTPIDAEMAYVGAIVDGQAEIKHFDGRELQDIEEPVRVYPEFPLTWQEWPGAENISLTILSHWLPPSRWLCIPGLYLAFTHRYVWCPRADQIYIPDHVIESFILGLCSRGYLTAVNTCCLG